VINKIHHIYNDFAGDLWIFVDTAMILIPFNFLKTMSNFVVNSFNSFFEFNLGNKMQFDSFPRISSIRELIQIKPFASSLNCFQKSFQQLYQKYKHAITSTEGCIYVSLFVNFLFSNCLTSRGNII